MGEGRNVKVMLRPRPFARPRWRDCSCRVGAIVDVGGVVDEIVGDQVEDAAGGGSGVDDAVEIERSRSGLTRSLNLAVRGGRAVAGVNGHRVRGDHRSREARIGDFCRAGGDGGLPGGQHGMVAQVTYAVTPTSLYARDAGSSGAGNDNPAAGLNGEIEGRAGQARLVLYRQFSAVAEGLVEGAGQL